MPKDYDGWAVRSPKGDWVAMGVRGDDAKAEAAQVAETMVGSSYERLCGEWAWRDMYRDGYRCVKVKITEVKND